MKQDQTNGRPQPERTLLRRLIERPQQTWPRRALFQIHLWAGLLVGLYVVVIGMSGSLLVFKEELLPRPHVALAHRDLRRCTPEQLAETINAVNRSSPSWQVNLASCPDEAVPLFAITVHKAFGPASENDSQSAGKHAPATLTVYVSPADGRIVGQADQARSWIHWVDLLHMYLLMGPRGETLNGVGAAVLLVLVTTGVALWWPGINRWRRALWVDLRRGWKRINWDFHGAAGFWTVCFTLLWATTGIVFAWPEQVTAAIEHISPVVTAAYPAAQLAQALGEVSTNPEPTMDVLGMLRNARQTSPKGVLEGCFFGSGRQPMFTVYMARGRMGDYANTDFVYFDQNSGRHLYTWHRGENQTLGDWIFWLTVPLHFGTSWGLLFKSLWACVGLALPVLALSGFLMYWNRYLCKHWFRSSPKSNKEKQCSS